MILCAFFFALLYSLLSSGAPVATTLPNDNGEPVFLTNYRSTLQIIWTCLTIVFASTWVCIHPHIYGYKSTLRQRIGRRLRLFSNALLFPDYFVQRAFEQWMGCRELYTQMKEQAEGLNIDLEPPSGESLWTPVHAQFIQMGGVIFRTSYGSVKSVKSSSRRQDSGEDDAGDTGSLTSEETVEGNDDQERRESTEPEDWETATLKPHIEGDEGTTNTADVISYKDFRDWDEADIRSFFALKLTKNQVEDKSKADGLAKAFVIIQCIWFVVQCIGRAVYRLPVLELEITCLAFIACNIGMYSFWWKKPMNIVCPVEIHRGLEEPDKTSTGSRGENADVGDWISAVIETLRSGDVGHLAKPAEGLSAFMTIEPTSALYPANYVYSRTGDTREVGLLKEWGFWLWVAYTIVPAIFGALHSIAWYSSFPSETQQLLWRASCVIPAVHALLYICAMLVKGISDPQDPSSWLGRCAWCAFEVIAGIIPFVVHLFISTPINLAARFAFIVLPLLQLRNLPSLAHQTVPWSDFLPHV